MVQWVKDPVLSLQQVIAVLWVQPPAQELPHAKKKKKEIKIKGSPLLCPAHCRKRPGGGINGGVIHVRAACQDQLPPDVVTERNTTLPAP